MDIFLNPPNSPKVVDSEKKCLKDAKAIFADTNINITADGRKHLGDVVGSKTYKLQYAEDLVNDWNTQLKFLSTIAENQPQVAYLESVSGFRSKLNYFIRTIPEISHHLLSLEEKVTERKLLSLPTRFGGLGIPIFSEEATVEYSNSRKLTAQLAPLIKNQIKQYTVNKTQIKITSQGHKKENQG